MNVRVRKAEMKTPGESHLGAERETELRRKLRNNSQMQKKNQEELGPMKDGENISWNPELWRQKPPRSDKISSGNDPFDLNPQRSLASVVSVDA